METRYFTQLLIKLLLLLLLINIKLILISPVKQNSVITWGSEGAAPRILDLGTRSRRVVRFTLLLLYSKQKPVVKDRSHVLAVHTHDKIRSTLPKRRYLLTSRPGITFQSM